MTLSSQPCKAGSKNPADRRREPRFESTEPLDLYIVEGRSKSWLGAGVLRDIATSGACFVAPFQIEAGRQIQLKWSGGDVEAVVRHCGAVGDRYLMGVEFVKSSVPGGDPEWSPLPATW